MENFPLRQKISSPQKSVVEKSGPFFFSGSFPELIFYPSCRLNFVIMCPDRGLFFIYLARHLLFFSFWRCMSFNSRKYSSVIVHYSFFRELLFFIYWTSWTNSVIFLIFFFAVSIYFSYSIFWGNSHLCFQNLILSSYLC